MSDIGCVKEDPCPKQMAELLDEIERLRAERDGLRGRVRDLEGLIEKSYQKAFAPSPIEAKGRY